MIIVKYPFVKALDLAKVSLDYFSKEDILINRIMRDKILNCFNENWGDLLGVRKVALRN